MVVPATAHLIARYAAGLADDLLTATLLATRAPVLLCPAMHTEMWEQPSVQENLATLRRRGVLVLEPEVGTARRRRRGRRPTAPSPRRSPSSSERIVEGYRGRSRAARPRERRWHARGHRPRARHLTNRSSGRQGHALAEVATSHGCLGHAWSRRCDRALALDVAGAIDVVRGRERATRCATRCSSERPRSDCVIMAAAVADFTLTPATRS